MYRLKDARRNIQGILSEDPPFTTVFEHLNVMAEYHDKQCSLDGVTVARVISDRSSMPEITVLIDLERWGTVMDETALLHLATLMLPTLWALEIWTDTDLYGLQVDIGHGYVNEVPSSLKHLADKGQIPRYEQVAWVTLWISDWT